MKLKSFSLILIAAIGLASFGVKADYLHMEHFAHTNKLMVAGYAGSETLVNFPVLVRVNAIAGFQYSDMSDPTKGRDLAFFDVNGNHLESEIDTWRDKNSSESLVWVKLPQMENGTRFFMCYNTSASGVYVTNNVPWNDYVGVWHLSESGNTGTAIADSTTNHLDGIAAANNTEGVNGSNGAIGRARKIAANKYHAPGIIVEATNGVRKAIADGLGTDFIASFWMKPANVDMKWSNLIGRRKGDLGQSWGVCVDDDSKGLRIYSTDDRILTGNNPQQKFVTTARTVYNRTPTIANEFPTLKDRDNWNKVDVIWKHVDGSPCYEVYTNGVLGAAGQLLGEVDLVDANIGIGCSTQDEYSNANTASNAELKGRRFYGDMDEVRLRPGVPGAVWIKADFDTVNNPNFVTLAPADDLTVSWADSSGISGVTNVTWNSAVVGCTIIGFGAAQSATIKGKFWADGDAEPSEWTALSAAISQVGDISVTSPVLVENTAYNYELCVVDDGGNIKSQVSGTFTTPVGLAVTWAELYGSVGVTNVAAASVAVGGAIQSLGSSATCAVEGKFWKDGDSEPAVWTTIVADIAQTGDFSGVVSGLEEGVFYNYKLRARGGNGVATEPIVGTFTTAPGLTVLWSESTGIEQIGYDFIKIGGTVTALGTASSCIVQRKIWESGESEPGWMTIKTGLGQNAEFTATISNLTAGTTYNYALRAIGDDGEEETVPVTGTFTTQGEAGEVIGSPYTHFFDDGTNSYWVVDDFERYLEFTVTGYTGTETLTNFPVLVDVRASDTNGFTYADFYHSDGSAIAFVDEKGHIIPHEIDTWNKSGMSLIWVRLPRMNNGTKFTMCYRSPKIDPLPDVGNTFERYVGVWHMNETHNGVVEVKDSTDNKLDGETHAESQAGINVGQMIGGNCRRVAMSPGTSANLGRIIVFDRGDILRTGVGNVFTYSGWYKLAEEPPKWAYLVSRKTMDQDRGWGIQYAESIKDGGSAPVLRVWSGSSAKNEFQKFTVTGADATGWNYWTFIYDGSVNADGTTNQLFHAYLNGHELQSTVGGFHLDYDVANDETATYENLVIGGQQTGTGAFNGWVDECRYSKGMRSADWIKAEYDSMRQKDVPFVTKAATVGRGKESLVPVVVWERGSGLPDTIIDVSYAYVQFAGLVTYCGVGADECRIEYQLWADGEEVPTEWTTLIDHVVAGQSFSEPVTGLKQDMPYNFRIRAVNEVNDHEQSNREHTGTFRTDGNVNETTDEGELFRVDNRFVHRYRAGTYNFTTPDYATNIEIMVVAGGGGGGYKVGGGGGGGGLFHSTSFPVETNTQYKIHVGRGGKGATNLTDRAENGDISYFALASRENNPLIRMHGGGGGGSFKADEDIAKGADGASGGGGTYAFDGGSNLDLGLPAEMRPFGHAGGRGNDTLAGGADRKSAAGGGGGAGRAGLTASFDLWWGGGSGGVGVECAVTGETLFYGAGGGGGYVYKTADSSSGTNFTKPGAGGSGIGGHAADVRNGLPATSGVANTGAGGGGGSMTLNANKEEIYWKGGDGGDGVVLISYEIHGREPISEDPRITMLDCTYTDEHGFAEIPYRIYWAGIQMERDDLYVLYSTVSSNEVANGEGTWVKVGTEAIGMAMTTFTPPEVGYTYWVRLVARKEANSFMYSDEIASFEVPAIRNNGADWHMPNAETNTYDYATIYYNLYYMAEDAHLYLYWSENREDLEGDVAPSGAGVRFLDLGTGRQSADSFTVPASEGFERNKTYYTRLATGNEAGTKYFLSKAIIVLETIDKPRVIFPTATWSNNVATVKFLETTANLDPATVDLVAYYGSNAEVGGNKIKDSALSENLGNCAEYPDDVETITQFPMWSLVDTNYYVRLALVTNGVVACLSQRTQFLELITKVPTNTLVVYANAIPKVGCYGDEPQTLDYYITYGGYTNGVGWTYYENNYKSQVEGATLGCEVTSLSNVGEYDILPGALADVILPTYRDETDVDYYYERIFTGSEYTITNAHFTATVEDKVLSYTGEALDFSGLVHSELNVRNSQPVTYLYRIVGTNEWFTTLPSDYTDVGNYQVQFKASAPNHDDVFGMFKVVVNPAPLTATISTPDFPYTGDAQTPVVTTNVTGLLHPELNPLTCQFRDESGEWLDEVPAFTQPGTYKLFFRVSAPNHTTFVTNCTFTISGWDFMVNMDGETGYETPITMGRPRWLIDNSGKTGEYLADDTARYETLDAICPNGLRLWQNYVLERKDFGKKVVATIMQQGNLVLPNSFVVHFPNIEPLAEAITGLKVQYRLDKKLRSERSKAEFAAADFDEGELTGKYELNIPLDQGDPTGLYVFNLVFTPTNELYTGQSVISSVTTIGVLRVSCALTNAVTVAPWLSMSVDSTNEIEVAVTDVVNPNSIGAQDSIRAYEVTPEAVTYREWNRQEDGGWDAPRTVTTRGVSQSAAETASFAPGKAFWLVRKAPGPYVYLIGRYTGEDYFFDLQGGATNAPGATLVANPTFFDVDLNDLVFVDGAGNATSPAAGDRISFLDIAGMQTFYSRDSTNTSWGRTVYEKVGSRWRPKWVEDGTVPSGTGFWYYRSTDEGALRIKFESSR